MRMRLWMWIVPLVLIPSLATAAKPEGWFLAGNDPSAYEMERDSTVVRDGKSSGRLASRRVSKGFGTMMQSFDADLYKGKRLRYAAYVKASKVKDWAGLWMRVDGEPREMLGFDNMQDRPIQGTKGWARYEIVLDVPDGARAIAFGILLSGEGTVWLNDAQFETVDTSVRTTGTSGSSKQAKKPKNLDFGH